MAAPAARLAATSISHVVMTSSVVVAVADKLLGAGAGISQLNKNTQLSTTQS
jgi:hypothetical protein